MDCSACVGWCVWVGALSWLVHGWGLGWDQLEVRLGWVLLLQIAFASIHNVLECLTGVDKVAHGLVLGFGNPIFWVFWNVLMLPTRLVITIPKGSANRNPATSALVVPHERH